MGLGPEPHFKLQISPSDEEIRLVRSLLEQILESFEDAKRVSERFKKHTSIQNANSNELLVCNATSGLTQDDQRVLCTTEVSVINKSQDLVLLNNVAREDNQMFSAEITKELEKRGHNVTDWKANRSSKMWIGDKNTFGVNSKGYNAARFTVSDRVDIYIGNINKGKWQESYLRVE